LLHACQHAKLHQQNKNQAETLILQLLLKQDK